MQNLTLLTLILFPLSLCAAAQTSSSVAGITLSGDIQDPKIENHSGKTLLWAEWTLHTTGEPSLGGIWLMDPASGSSGLPDGDSAKATHRRFKVKINSATITAAIFADGEFRGADNSPIRHAVESDFQLTREAWQWAQAGEWDKLQARADEVDIGIVPVIAAKKLLQARGNDTAMAALAFLGTLPASTWTGGAAMMHKIPNFLAELAMLPFNTFQPALHAQTNPPWGSGTVYPYPQSGTDASTLAPGLT